MSNPAETLSQMIEALTEESSKTRRRTHANTAYAALRQMREAQPPTNVEEAERRGYEAGILAAMELLRKTQSDLDEPLRKASYTHSVLGATGALDSLRHYADGVIVQFEIRAGAMLREHGKKGSHEALRPVLERGLLPVVAQGRVRRAGPREAGAAHVLQNLLAVPGSPPGREEGPMRGRHPIHLTHAYNLPRIRCGASSKGKRRTTSAEELLRDVNPCIDCAPIAKAEIDAADKGEP